jgi:hypothetical protein
MSNIRCSANNVRPNRAAQNSKFIAQLIESSVQNKNNILGSGSLQQIPGQFGINSGHGMHRGDSGTVLANPGRLEKNTNRGLEKCVIFCVQINKRIQVHYIHKPF